jgi:hypothetical protein
MKFVNELSRRAVVKKTLAALTGTAGESETVPALCDPVA